MSRTRRRWSSASRTAPWTCGTQRSEYGSWTLCADAWCAAWRPEPRRRWRSSPATATCPGCGRASWYGAANATSVPSSASTDIAAATDAVRTSRSASASSSAPSADISCVPLSSASPSFGSSVQRLQAALAERDQRRHDLAVDLHLAAADERQREVGQRREVPGRADAALLRDDRVDPGSSKAQIGRRAAAGSPSARARACSPAAAASRGRPRAGTAGRRPPRARRAGSPGAAPRPRAG